MSKCVSVIIPTYKRPLTLVRAINSVLYQTYQNIEIIVVDDNNPETEARTETERLMLQYEKNTKVKYIKHEKNRNGSAARNTGYRISKGSYIMFLDDDDEFFPEKVESQVNCLENRDATWGACYTKHVVKRNNKIIYKGVENKEGYLVVEQLKRNLFIAAGSNLMIRRHIIDEVNGFNESFERNQDVEFLLKILQKYKLAYVDILGLSVYVDKNRHLNTRNINFEKITDLFITTFEPYLNTLSDKERAEIQKMINLQRFRNKLLGKKNIGEAFFMLKNREVSFQDAFLYILHLIDRFITKSRKGFSLNSN